MNTLADALKPGDNISCVGGAGVGPVKLLRNLARLRAIATCQLVAKRVPGVRIAVSIALRGEIQVAQPLAQSQLDTSTVLQVAASDLSRRVLVVARSG